MRLNRLLLTTFILTALSACGGGSSVSPSDNPVPNIPDVPAPAPAPAPTPDSLFSFNANDVALNENDTVSLPFSVLYNGPGTWSVDITAIDTPELQGWFDGENLIISAEEVRADKEAVVQVELIVDGQLVDSTSFTVSIANSLNSYILNTPDGIMEVRGTIESITLNRTTMTLGERLDFPVDDGMIINFGEEVGSYSVLLSNLTNFTIDDEKVVSQDYDRLTALKIGQTSATFELDGVQGSAQILVQAPGAEQPERDMPDHGLFGIAQYEKILALPDVHTQDNSYLMVDSPVLTPAKKVVVNLLVDGIVQDSVITEDDGFFHFKDIGNLDEQSVTLQIEARLEFDGDLENATYLSVFNKLENGDVYTTSNEPITLDATQANRQDFSLTAAFNAEREAFDFKAGQAQPFNILNDMLKTVRYFEKNFDVDFSTHSLPNVVFSTQEEDRPLRSDSYYKANSNTIVIGGGHEGVTLSVWNEVVAAHEFAHYYQKKIMGRDDSRGGQHSLTGSSEPVLQFSESFAQAIAFAVTGRWASLGGSFDGGFIASYEDLKRVAANPDDGCQSTRTTTITYPDGSEETNEINGPCRVIGNFTEITGIYYFLSFLDEQADDTAYSTNMFKAHGIGGKALMDAIVHSNNTDSLLTIMSLTETLIELHPKARTTIELLNEKLNLEYTDKWGTDIASMNSLVISSDEVLPTDVYLPLYAEASVNENTQICFNDAIYDANEYNVGNTRYAKFTATSTGTMIFSSDGVPNLDEDLYSSLNMSVYNKGITPPGTILFPSGPDTLEFYAEAGKTYVFRLVNEVMKNTAGRANETVCTNITISAADE